MTLSTVKIISAGYSDKGRIRKNNEDFFLVDDDLGLYAVADGIGGHSGGEIASRMSVQALREVVKENELRKPSATASEFVTQTVVSLLENAFRTANNKLLDAGRSSPELSGMGTTLTTVFFDGLNAHIAHAGDSRAYRLRNGELVQLTDDHAVVAEQVRAGLIRPDQARKNPYRHIITRALGIEPEIAADHRTVSLAEGDVFLLCTDGLTEMVEDPEIERILLRNDPSSAASKLVSAANEHGGVDNITVVIVKVDRFR